MDLMTLKATLGLDSSQYESGIKSAQGLASSFSVAFGNLISQGITKSIGAVKDFTGYVMQSGMSFESTMSKVQAISGATGDDLTSLTEKAKEMGSKTKFSATESAEAFTYMAMAGWKTEDMLGGIEGIMNLAAASGEDLARTSDIVTDALTAFGMTADESGHFADILAAASSNANTNVSMLGESFKYVAPVAGAMGYSAEDVSVALGLMANAGIKASQGGTSLRTLLTNMVKPTDEMAIAMQELGVSIQDDEGNMYSFRQIMDQLRSGFGQLKISEEELKNALAEYDKMLADGTITEKQYNEGVQILMEQAYGAEGALKAQYAASLAGARGLSGLLAIVNASEDDYNKLFNAVDNCSQVIVKTTDGAYIPMTEAIKQGVKWTEEFEGASAAMAAIMQDNVAGSVTILKSSIEGLALTFYEGISKTAKDSVDKLTEAVVKVTAKVKEWVQSDATQEKLGKISDKIGALMDKIIGGLDPALDGLVGIIDKVVDGIGFLIDHFDQIVGAVKIAVEAFIAFKAAMAAIQFATMIANIGKLVASINPIGIAITALIAIIALLITHWDDVKKGAQLAWNDIKNAWNSAASWFKGIVSNIANAFSGIDEKVANFFKTALEKIKSTWQSITSWFGSIVSNVVNAFQSIPSKLSDFFKNALDKAKSVWQTATSWFSGIVNNVVNAFQSVPSKIQQFFSNAWNNVKNAWNSATSWFSSLASNIVNGFTSIPSKIQNFFTNAWNSVKNAWSSATSHFSSVGSNIVSAISRAISGLPSQALGWARDMMQGFANGITRFMSTVTQPIKNLASKIASFLHFSRPDEGPLRDYEQWMPDFLAGMAKGIEQNTWRLEDAAEDAAQALAGGFADTGLSSMSGSNTLGSNGLLGNGVNITINIDGAKYNDERSLAEAISEELQGLVARRQAVFA